MIAPPSCYRRDWATVLESAERSWEPWDPQGMLSPLRYRKEPLALYFTSSYIIGTGYQDFPFLWYNYGTKSGIFPII